MKTIEIVRGGSGRYVVYAPSQRRGAQVADGHVPSAATYGRPEAAFTDIVKRQVGRSLLEYPGGYRPQYRIKGGSLYSLEVEDATYDALVARTCSPHEH